MQTLYLDIFSGISGDMFLGAMIDLGVGIEQLESQLAKLGLEGYHIHASRMVKANIEGIKFDVHVAPDGGEPHEHEEAGSAPDPHLGTPPFGPHGGPLVETSIGRVELSVFETGVPPRFRLYFTDRKRKGIIPPSAGAVTLETIRPDRKRQTFRFKRHGQYLEAATLLPEPHEFHAILKLKGRKGAERHEIEFVEAAHHHHAPQGGHHHEHDHTHPHQHHAGHHHPHVHSEGHGRDFAEITQLIQASELSEWVKDKAVRIFRRVAEAEGKIHGQPAERVHFHEVGAVDSIVDIVGGCIALELLGKPRVIAASVVEGTGWVDCAHGRFPVPTLATLEILGARRIPVTQCEEPHELVTPTGAAILAEFAEGFGPMQGLIASKVGYGLGTRENRTRPNVLRAILGDTAGTELSATQTSRHDWETDHIAVLETNLDDCPAEILGHLVERAFAAGALDVFHTPIQMKKNRPGVTLSVLCPIGIADSLTELILRETSAFGVRRYHAERRKLKREFTTVQTPFGKATVKLGKLNGKIVQVAPEFESCRTLALAANVPLKQVYDSASREALAKLP